MQNRVLMARYNPSMMVVVGDATCGCGQGFDKGETVALYPCPEYDNEHVRSISCLTCHFWFVHEIMSELS